MLSARPVLHFAFRRFSTGHRSMACVRTASHTPNVSSNLGLAFEALGAFFTRVIERGLVVVKPLKANGNTRWTGVILSPVVVLIPGKF